MDISARFGIDASSAARSLGRALDEPGESLERLRSIGLRFTDAEQQVIKSLNDTGNAAEAQRLILQRLEGTIGGSAEGGSQGGIINALNRWRNSLISVGDALVNLAPVTEASERVRAIQAEIDRISESYEALSQREIISEKQINDFEIQLELLRQTRNEQLLLIAQIEGSDGAIASARANIEANQQNLQLLRGQSREQENINQEKKDELEIAGEIQERNNSLVSGIAGIASQFSDVNERARSFLDILGNVGSIIEGLGGGSGISDFASSIGGLFGFCQRRSF